MFHLVLHRLPCVLNEAHHTRRLLTRRNNLVILKVTERFAHGGKSGEMSATIAQTMKETSMNPTALTSHAPLSGISVAGGGGTLTRCDKIIKSVQDNREYRGLELANGLKVLLISDPTTDIAAAALSVAVGHMSDPVNVPGLAHFCEHMLFLGTEKYVNENDYMAFLSANGGTSNAATFADSTKYYFDVVPGKLEEALDRFSQFFIAPLFTESATQREINAVQSEHEKNLSLDVWRIKQVNRLLSHPSHPYNRFGTGNKKTLQDDPAAAGIDIREELMKFHQKWYSANIMSLAVFGKESLDELEAMTVKLFSDIENKNVTEPRWTDMPYQEEQLATRTYIVPVKDNRSMRISFQTEDLEKYYKSGPEHYVSNLIGHEGVGSVLSELKARGWCNNLMCGYSSVARGFGMFEVMMDLTQEGYDHVNDVINLLFQYINMIKAEGPRKWIFTEYCNLGEMHFRFKDKENPLTLVTNVVNSIQIFPLEDVLSALYLTTEWRPDLIEDLCSKLCPENARILIVGQKCASIANMEEPWYGTKYTTEKIAPELLQAWSTKEHHENLKLPEPNPFIPTNFELLPVDADVQSVPVIIQNSPLMRVWLKQDIEFLKPKTLMNFDFCSPIVYSNPLNCNLTHLFVQLLKDHLNEYLYAADLAGLSFGVTNTTSGISLGIGGYSDKQGILLEKVLDCMFNFSFEEQRFEIIKEQYIRGLKNHQADQPYLHAIYYLAVLLTEQAWTKNELMEATSLLTVEKMRAFIDELLSRVHVECFIYGNVNREKAHEIAGKVEEKIKVTNTLPLLARQLLLKREYKLNTGESCLFEATNEFHKSSCAELYIQCGMQNDNSNAYVDLITHIINEPCYNQLRTKEQLGYIVVCGSRRANGVHGIRIIVQSARHPNFVEERIETFLNDMVEYINNMTEVEFNRHKDALTVQKLEKPKRLLMQFNRFLNEISLQQYHFNRAQVEVAALRTLTKEQILEYYKQYIVLGAPSRRSLSIHVLSTAEGGVGSDTAAAEISEKTTNETTVKKDFVTIGDLVGFKSSRSLYPLAQPYINITPKGSKCKL